MFNWKESIISVLIFIVTIAVIGIRLQRTTRPISSEIELLEKDADSITREINGIDQQLLEHYNRSDSLQKITKQTQQKIQQIEKIKDEQILRIDHITDVELYEFFANFDTQDRIAN